MQCLTHMPHTHLGILVCTDICASVEMETERVLMICYTSISFILCRRQRELKINHNPRTQRLWNQQNIILWNQQNLTLWNQQNLNPCQDTEYHLFTVTFKLNLSLLSLVLNISLFPILLFFSITLLCRISSCTNFFKKNYFLCRGS